jgi:hypothetical protein
MYTSMILCIPTDAERQGKRCCAFSYVEGGDHGLGLDQSDRWRAGDGTIRLAELLEQEIGGFAAPPMP